jgi:hypothetical protein
MKLIRNVACCLVLLLIGFSPLNAQLYKIDLKHKINKASLIVEGSVTDQYSFWNDEHTIIYTANKVHLYKIFKGQVVSKEIEVLTQGGTVGTKCLKVSDVLQLKKGETGMFFLYENALRIPSPSTKKILFDVYSSKQGFLRYNKAKKAAVAPFAAYENPGKTLYNEIKKQSGVQEKVLDATFKVDAGDVSNGTADASIVSFAPATIHAGAINDAANNILTITGSGFGNTPSDEAGVEFKDGNSDNTDPDYKVDYNSPYILSWTDTQIKLNVPDRAGTGKFAVVLNDGTEIISATDLQVFFAVLDAEFTLNGKDFVREPRLMNTNGSGGYTYQYSTSTAGGGIDFTTSPAKQTFQRAVNTWKEIAGANLVEGSPTAVQKVEDDNINLVVFDNNNTTVPKMADGVLESTYSWFSACSVNDDILTAQKTGFDILIRNDKVSTGDDISFEFGPCFPATGSYDLEMIILHEIGHALNLSHINDDYENDGGNYQRINPSKLMHYAILDYVDRRSPDASAYQGALYTITPQHNDYGDCGLFKTEMTPLTTSAISNDDCPSTFPSTVLQDNTTISFDLVHATSNKFVDPSFKQVNCKNTGTPVTNNAYYAFLTGTKKDIELDITNYTTVPADLASCNAQGVLLALYDVQSCPTGQSYPQPVVCSQFSSNSLIKLSGLEQNHKYLLYFDGIRNTKASFVVTFNSDSSHQSPASDINVFPNPVTTIANLQISNATPGSTYEYAVYDAIGKLVLTGKVSVTQSQQTFPIYLISVASGVYFIKLVDENGDKVATKKILKLNQK